MLYFSTVINKILNCDIPPVFLIEWVDFKKKNHTFSSKHTMTSDKSVTRFWNVNVQGRRSSEYYPARRDGNRHQHLWGCTLFTPYQPTSG